MKTFCAIVSLLSALALAACGGMPVVTGNPVEAKRVDQQVVSVCYYAATIRVRDAEDGGCDVEWSSEFDPSGASEGDAVKVIEGIFQTGLDNLNKMFGR